MSLTDHINQVRIEASKTELLNTSLSVNEIALKVGFTYQNHFARIFRKYTGLSPLDYRERKSKKRPENIRRK
jgi:AraC-like DNA-binding protein